MDTRLAKDLLEQAAFLANKEPKRPKQASLRRAISAAYYALFHRIIVMSCVTLTGNSRRSKFWIHAPLQRAFSHADIKHVCVDFVKDPAPKRLESYLSSLPASDSAARDSLKSVCELFLVMQEQRHDADYNFSYLFEKNPVLQKIEDTSEALALIESTEKNHPELTAAFATLCFLYKKSKHF